MNLSQLDPAVVSVITSGIVAIFAALAPAITTYFSERLRWKREFRQAKFSAIDSAAIELLESMADFRTKNTDVYASKLIAQHASLLSRYFRWEYAISSHLGKKEKEQVLKLRQKVEKIDGIKLDNLVASIAEQVPEWTLEVREISDKAKNRL